MNRVVMGIVDHPGTPIFAIDVTVAAEFVNNERLEIPEASHYPPVGKIRVPASMIRSGRQRVHIWEVSSRSLQPKRKLKTPQFQALKLLDCGRHGGHRPDAGTKVYVANDYALSRNLPMEYQCVKTILQGP